MGLIRQAHPSLVVLRACAREGGTEIVKVRRAFDVYLLSVGGERRLVSPREGVIFEGSALSDPRLTQFLIELDAWRDLDDVIASLTTISGISPETATKEVGRLMEAGLVVADADAGQVATVRGRERWAALGWRDAFSYHVVSDEIERLDYGGPDGQQQDNEGTRDTLATEPLPPIHMAAASSDVTGLVPPAQSLDAPVGTVFGERPAAGAAMTEQDLSTLLWWAFGQIGIKRQPITGDHVRKTSPSGGSKHPTEAYPILLRDLGSLAAGAYHYGVADHVLERIAPPPSVGWVAENVVGKPEWMTEPPSVVIVLTSRVITSMYRYRENYSYRPIHHDVGHLLETAVMVAGTLSVPIFRGYSVRPEPVSDYLQTERLMNPTMAFLLVG